MPAAVVCRRLIAAVDGRDWATAATLLDERTVVTDHRDLPFIGDGRAMLEVWRSAFGSVPDARAELDVLDDDETAAVVRMRFGEPGRRLAVHVVAEIRDGRVARFD